MKLIEALQLVARQPAEGAPFHVYLACGFMPLHLRILLAAHLASRLGHRRVEIGEGIYGDLFGNINSGLKSSADAIACTVEWSDLDGRLGVRSLGGWRTSALEDILSGV